MRSYSPQALSRAVASDYIPSSHTTSSALRVVDGNLLRRTFKRSAVVVGLICVISAVAAVVSFPEADDGSLLLTIHELGSKAIVASYPENPLAAWIWQCLLDSANVYFWPMVILLNALLWACLGLEACYLWIRAVPEEHGYAPLIGCLCVAPVVVNTQTTLTVGFTAVLPSVLGYFALILILRNLERHSSGISNVLPILLVGVAASFGDYGLSVELIIFTLLLRSAFQQVDLRGQARCRVAAWTTLALTLAIYVLYQIVVLPTYTARGPRASFLSGLTSFPPNLFSAVWHVVIGAYGTPLANFYVSWSSKTTLVSLLFGIFFAWVLTLSVADVTAEVPISGRRLKILFVAIVAGLTPAIFHRGYPLAGDFPLQAAGVSRLFIPVIPTAAYFTTSLLLLFVRPPSRQLFVGVLALVIGFSTLNQVWSGFRRQRLLMSVGSALKPHVDTGAGKIVGVLSNDDLCLTGYSCTAKASAAWPVDISRHFWLYSQREALDDFGSRGKCKPVTDLHTGTRVVHRNGPISGIFWVQISGDGVRLESYCLGTQASSNPTLLPMVAVPPIRPVQGTLNASFEKTQGAQDLTSLGTADWEHWTSASVSNHKLSGREQISYYNTVGGGTVLNETDSSVVFDWSDGMPSETAADVMSHTALAGRGYGFQITAPADVNTRTLLVYVGVKKAEGEMRAHLTDSSASDYIDSSSTKLNGTGERRYKFVYRAGLPKQSLIVTFKQVSSNPRGRISLHAAALVENNTN
jgi:hypothetical protein